MLLLALLLLQPTPLLVLLPPLATLPRLLVMLPRLLLTLLLTLLLLPPRSNFSLRQKSHRKVAFFLRGVLHPLSVPTNSRTSAATDKGAQPSALLLMVM